MFSIDNFLEIQVVGFLMLLAISPALNLSTTFRTRRGFCPLFDNIKTESAKAILLLIFAFSVGIASNRLVDELFDTLNVEGREEYQYKNPVATRSLRECFKVVIQPSRELQFERPSVNANCIGKYGGKFNEWLLGKNDPTKLETIKLAEYYVSDHSETARDYFERHKSFMRVLRGAACASLLLLLTMAIYQLTRTKRFRKSSFYTRRLKGKIYQLRRREIVRKNSRPALPCERYRISHFIIVFAFFLTFSLAYKFEAHHYYNRVFDMYKDYPFEENKLPKKE